MLTNKKVLEILSGLGVKNSQLHDIKQLKFPYSPKLVSIFWW